MRVLVTGSRTWTDREFLWGVLDSIAENAAKQGVEEMTVVHGDATGADALADAWVRVVAGAVYLNGPPRIRVERHQADWRKHGKRAGILRNLEMVNLGADFCAAFIRGESRGTRHCADAAEAAGIPTERWEQP